MTQAPPPTHPRLRATADALKRHIRREIVLPFAIAGAALTVLIIVAVLITGPVRVEFVSNFLLTFFILIPMVLCVFPLYLLTVIGAFLMWRLANRTTAPLQRIEALSVKMTEGAARISKAAAERGIALDAASAHIETMVNIFDRPETQGPDKPVLQPPTDTSLTRRENPDV